MKQRKLMFAVFALLLLFAACKGESPTSPTTTPPTTGTTGGTTPPSGASVTLTVSNANPLTSSTSVITATVTENGQPVPNGTAVQFTASGTGTFTDVGASGNTIIRTTTNGVATATVTSGTPGAVTVTATVNNVSKNTLITFTSQPVTPPPPGNAPTITSVTPQTGRPQGGETITINGTNFRAPIRVLFTCEGTAGTTPDPTGCTGQGPKEAFVASVTPTQITAITPSFNVPAGKALQFSVTVIVGAGTSNEVSISQAASFIETSPTLTPVIRGVTPSSGPIGGGTRVTIIGDAFQAPVQVFFNAAEAQVISTNFNQIIVMSPRASDTAPTGSGTITGPVDVRVRNIGSGTEVTYAGGFRYTPKMQITTVTPTSGPVTGGTKVTIDGTGFDDPLAVTIGGVAAQVIRVSGTEVVAITRPPLLTPCGNTAGPISVTNTENGDTADAAPIVFTFVAPLPQVISATGPATPGGTTSVTVLNAQGIPRITIGDKPATITATTVNADGTTTFTVQVPSNLTLNTVACPSIAGATSQQQTQFGVTYTSLTTGCTNTFANGLTVNPGGPLLGVFPATGFTQFAATAAQAGPPPVPAVPAPDQTVTLTNTGGGTLTVTSVTNTCTNPPFTISAPPNGSVLNPCDVFPITVHYQTQAAGSSASCQIVVTTSAGTRTFNISGSTQ